MDERLPSSEKVFQIAVDHAGRMVLPAGSRVRQAFRDGEPLLAVEEPDGRLSILTYRDMVREVQEHFKSRIPKGLSLVDQLLADRRDEASRE